MKTELKLFALIQKIKTHSNLYVSVTTEPIFFKDLTFMETILVQHQIEYGQLVVDGIFFTFQKVYKDIDNLPIYLLLSWDSELTYYEAGKIFSKYTKEQDEQNAI